ncbi:GreA/GreB family elongation factor [Azospirillum brasilense]|uniref:Nucleoside diphosphate kinase regulator n=1 Tax=Azospirillum brasilense TaxID=192 RepID=A0A6L3AXH8_AZOBR|nr:GreA/GreB family elongation factor [Azospirillum brasilense]KAA0682622.1 nucleoside diphosphate kinase regulator [Azospirillum brasilense]
MNRKSMLGDPPPIRITPQDLGRLDVLLAHLSRPAGVIDFLQREVDRADVADPPDGGDGGTPFVRLGSRVTFADDRGTRHTATLITPDEAARRQDGISILTPVGAALLGLSEGQSIAYGTLDGRTKSVQVLRIEPPAA